MNAMFMPRVSVDTTTREKKALTREPTVHVNTSVSSESMDSVSFVNLSKQKETYKPLLQIFNSKESEAFCKHILLGH